VEIKCQLDATDEFLLHLLHLVGILFPHIIDDARSKPHQKNNCSLQIVRIVSKEYNKVHNITLRDIKLCSVRKPVGGTTRHRPHAVTSKLAQGAVAGGEASTAGNCFGERSEIRSVLTLSDELHSLHLFLTRRHSSPRNINFYSSSRHAMP
jgi:hypothetical protein